MPKRSSDNYIQLKKKVTDKKVLALVSILTQEWLLTPQEVCYRLMNEAAIREMEKRKK